MRIDLINCILDLLQKNSIVALPGLGSLRLERDSARIAKNKIHPPSRHIKFSTKIEEVEQFVHYLKDKYGISTDNAERVLKRFSQRLINQLVNYNEVVLPKIGILKSNGSKALKLVKDESSISFTKNYLPVLSLERIAVKKSKKASLITTSVEDIKENTSLSTQAQSELPETPRIDIDKTDFNKPEAVAPIRQQPIIKQPVQTTHPKIGQGTVVLSSSEINKSNEASYHFEQDSAQNEGGSIWKVLFWIIGAMLFAFLLFKGCKDRGLVVDQDQTESNEGNNQDALDNQNQGDNETADYNPSKIYDESELDKIPDAVLAEGCVIIVGSFKKETNAAKMVQQLESKGYESYRELNPNGLKRVGLLFECVDEDLVKFIQNVRKDVEGKAWYLQPQIHVDY